MSHYSCKRCGQRYDDCHCHAEIKVKDFSLEQSLDRMELEDKIRRQYIEIRDIALSLGMDLRGLDIDR